MSRRFEGAITTPEDAQDSSSLPAPVRPSRPLAIEVASAILIIGALVGIVGTIGAALGLEPVATEPGSRAVIALIIALNLLTIVVGVLVRRGQLWIVCVNVVAVLLFVELTAVPGGNATAALLAVLDAFVFVAVMRNRPWFDWRSSLEHPAR